MKKCIYCAENIQDEAIKCRFCGEWLTEKPQLPLQENSLQSKDVYSANRIKIIGVGGGGSNTINRIIQSGITSIETIAINTDITSLSSSLAKTRVNIGTIITSGLGSNAYPEIGEKAAEESSEEIEEALTGADMVFITCGLGGGTGTGATPIIADIAKKLGIFTIGIFTKPFAFEGQRRSAIALQGLEAAKKIFDIIFIYENDRVLSVMDKKTPLLEAFQLIDEGIMTIIDFIRNIGPEDFKKLTSEKQILNIDLVPINKEELYGILLGDKNQQDLTGSSDIDLDVPAFIRNK